MGTPSGRAVLRRLLVILAMSLWQGGFLFYAAVVVPIGTDVLGSTAAQGAITRRVTHSLNLIGTAALAILAGELIAARDRSPRLTHRWMVWAVLLACQYLLFFLHQVLEYLLGDGLDAEGFTRLFYQLHRAYLWLSTLSWAAAWVWLGLSLKAWQAEDAARNLIEGK